MSFTTAYGPMMKIEKGYAKDPDDRGGETYNGVSRIKHPKLELWHVIDGEKQDPNFPKSLKRNVVLDEMIMDFYRREFWYEPNLDDVDDVDEFLAEKLFRLCVNFGPNRPCKWLQRAMNVLNRNQTRYEDIKPDGDIGRTTIRVLKECVKHNPIIRILNTMCVMQGAKYLNIMEGDETQEKYVGWMDRIFEGIYYEKITDYKRP